MKLFTVWHMIKNLLVKVPFCLLIFQLSGIAAGQGSFQNLRQGCICGLHSSLGHNPHCQCRDCHHHQRPTEKDKDNEAQKLDCHNGLIQITKKGNNLPRIDSACHSEKGKIDLRQLEDAKYFFTFYPGLFLEFLFSYNLSTKDEFLSRDFHLFPERPS